MIFVVILCLILGIIPTFGLDSFLSFRYGMYKPSFAALLVLLCSIVVALIVRANVDPADYEYNEEQVFPAEAWRKLKILDEIPTELEYRPDQGLLAKNDQRSVQITGELPVCISNGGIAGYWEISRSWPFEETSHPRVHLPPPPESPSLQTSFDVTLQFATNTDILGASSAVYENGEVWCTERVVQRGQAIGAGAAAGAGFSILFTIITSFIISFIIISVLSIICLELWYRQR